MQKKIHLILKKEALQGTCVACGRGGDKDAELSGFNEHHT